MHTRRYIRIVSLAVRIRPPLPPPSLFLYPSSSSSSLSSSSFFLSNLLVFIIRILSKERFPSLFSKLIMLIRLRFLDWVWLYYRTTPFVLHLAALQSFLLLNCRSCNIYFVKVQSTWNWLYWFMIYKVYKFNKYICISWWAPKLSYITLNCRIHSCILSHYKQNIACWCYTKTY